MSSDAFIGRAHTHTKLLDELSLSNTLLLRSFLRFLLISIFVCQVLLHFQCVAHSERSRGAVSFEDNRRGYTDLKRCAWSVSAGFHFHLGRIFSDCCRFFPLCRLSSVASVSFLSYVNVYLSTMLLCYLIFIRSFFFYLIASSWLLKQ
jgi:hypothetical protein